MSLRSMLKLAPLAVAAMPLGGCSLLGIPPLAHKSAPKVAIKVPNPVSAMPNETQAGRDHLAEGLTGAAIESFRRALSNGEPVAPAVNGLGVAYARLGRHDLAIRYFEEAAALDTANVFYRRNLELALRDQDVRMAAIQPKREDVVAAAPVRSMPKGFSLASAAPMGTLQRVSRNEVRIVTATAPARPAYSLAKSEPVGGRLIVSFASTNPSAAPETGNGTRRMTYIVSASPRGSNAAGDKQ